MSSVRLRIVINTHNRMSVDELLRLWDELVVLLWRVWEELTARTRARLARFRHQTRQTLCGLRGHDDRLRAERHHLALSCGRCGRVTSGWELPKSPRPYASPSRHHATEPGPRYFQLSRRES